MNTKSILISNAMIAAMLVAAHAVATELDAGKPVPVHILSEVSTFSTNDPARMSMREYETYRAELQRQIEDVNRKTATDDIEVDANDAGQSREIPSGTGYGQGYRARHRYGHDGTGMNFNRGGSMGTGAGRNR